MEMNRQQMIAQIFGHTARWNVDVFLNIAQFGGDSLSFASPSFTVSETFEIRTPTRDLIFKELNDETLAEVVRQMHLPGLVRAGMAIEGVDRHERSKSIIDKITQSETEWFLPR